jgi:sugar phosphate isomerase/epimerase
MANLQATIQVMRLDLADLEIGVMFWAGRDTLDQLRTLGVRCGQLGIRGGIVLTNDFAEQWRVDDFTIVTVVCGYEGESYTNMDAVTNTVGFLPDHTRAARERRTIEASDFAASLGVGSIACHIGCVPDDRSDGDYIAVRNVVRRICDHAAANRQTFALETGQESAEALLRFIDDTGRGNLKVNFDPANMVIYGTGEPMESFKKLAPFVVSIHAKDGDPPARGRVDALGVERKLGEGSVGIGRFIETVRRSGYRGTIHVERETKDQAQRLADIREAVELLRSLTL